MSPVHTRLLTRITAALALSAAPACGGSVDVESVSCYEPDAGQNCLPKDKAADRLPRVHKSCSDKKVTVEEGPFEQPHGERRQCCYQVVDSREYPKDTELPCGRPLLVGGHARRAEARAGGRWGTQGAARSAADPRGLSA